MQKEVYEFISKKTDDPIIERRTCRVSGEEFALFQSDKEFYEKISPTFGGEEFQIPFPTLCPEERQRRRMLYKNDKSLHRAICGLTGASIITIYDPEKHPVIYNTQDRWSDKRDPLEYGQEFDASKNFFEQYIDLQQHVPKIAMVNDNGVGSENCEYTQDLAYAKNCYLTSVAWKLEHAYYCNNMAGGRRLVDCFFVMDSENCYECIDSYSLHTCFWLQNSHACHNCWFGRELSGCRDCLLCVGLQNKQYCIMNKQYTKEEYMAHKKQFKQDVLDDVQAIQKRFVLFVLQFPRKAMNLLRADKVTFGSNLINAEESICCYNFRNIKYTKYAIFGDTAENCYDLTVGGEPQWCYEGVVPDNSYRSCFTIFCWTCTNVWYSSMCRYCQDCFACIGLKNKQYCIFNKQYTKETYEQLVAKIITHMKKPPIGSGHACEWGEFFPKECATFGYNETNADEYFPLSEQEALAKGYSWHKRTKEIDIPDDVTLLSHETIKKYNQTRQYPEDLDKKAIVGEVSGRAFKMLSEEMLFYKKYGLPFPTKHPDARVLERIETTPEKTLYLRTCDKTGEEVLSVYPADVPFKVYSESAYRQEVYG